MKKNRLIEFAKNVQNIIIQNDQISMMQMMCCRYRLVQNSKMRLNNTFIDFWGKKTLTITVDEYSEVCFESDGTQIIGELIISYKRNGKLIEWCRYSVCDEDDELKIYFKN